MLDKNKLVGAIAEAGLTQKEVAERIGMAQNTFSAKLNGKSCFDTEQIYAICEVLEIVDPIRKIQIFLS